MRKVIFTILAALVVISAHAQSAGDYQTKQSGDWNTAGTWQRYDGTAFVDATLPPDATAGIITIRNGHTVAVNNEVKGGQVIVEAGGVINWLSGYLNTSLTNNGTFNITNGFNIGNDANPDPVFNNNATLNWSSGYIYFYGATLNNNAAGTFYANDNGQMYLAAGSNLFNNAGTFTKQSGTGGIVISIPWQNSGSVNINEGVFYNNNSLVNTGIFNLASGKTLVNNGSFNWNAGSQLNGSGVFINNNTFILNTALNFPAGITFNQAGGQIQGGNLLTINGVINWTDGYLNTSLTNNGTFNIANGIFIGNDANPDPVFNNNATLNWSSGYIYFYGATLNNNAAGTFYANDNGQMYLAAGSNLFNNAGTFTKQSGTGGIVISIPWQNSGSVNINEGVFYNNNSLVNTGIFNLASGKTLVNNGSFNWNAGSQLNGSGVFINNNTFILNTALNFPAGITFNQAGGQIQGGNLLTINGVINWTDGYLNTSLTNNGTFNIANGIFIGNDANPDPVFNNNATLNWNSGYIYFYGATLNNNASGTFNTNDNGQMYLSTGSNLFNNAGTFTKQSGTGGIGISIPWQNSGTVNINEGVLYNSNSLVNTGIFNLASGKTLENNGSFNWNAGSQLNGSGVFINNNTFILNTALNFPADITFNQAGGQIQGGNLLTINSVINWTGGYLNTSLTNNGTFNLANDFNIGDNVDPDPVLNNNATFNWNSGNIIFRGATLNNNVSGTINANNNGQMYLATGSNLFNNAGTFTKQNSTSGTIIGIPWQNSGTVNINDGELNSNNTLVNTGVFNLASGKALVNNNTFYWNAGSQLNGSGTFRNYNTFILNTALNLAAGITFNQMSGQIRGGNLLTINGVINWTGGNLNTGLTNNGTFNLASNITIGDDADPDPVLNNNAIFNWNSGDIYFSGATLNNNAPGTINANGNNVMNYSAGSNLFNNTGTFIKQNGTGATTFNIPWQNSGTIKGIGTISSNSTFTNNGGTIEPGASPGILQFNGAQPFSATSMLQIEMQDGSGPGTGYDQLTRYGNLTLAGKLKVVKAVGFPDGSYTIIQLSSGNISGSFTELDIPQEYNISITSDKVILFIVDSDLDGVPDTEDCAPTDATKWQSGTLYIDNDGDGYDNGSQTICYGEIPAGYTQTTQGSDCNDNDANINPTTVWYKDADNDGYSDGTTQTQCNQPANYKLASQLTAISGDCNDNDANINPTTVWYKDADNDGYSDGTTQTQCNQPANYKLASQLTAISGDCDDNDANINPGTVWYQDADNDGYSDGTTQTQCNQPANYKLASQLTAISGDCDDNDANINPETVWYKDADNDGYSDGTTQTQCNQPANYKLASQLTAISGDCDDNDANINPETVWYQDADNDGYSDGTTQTQCNQPANYKLASQLTAISGDCDDNDATVYPGATEICDGKDNNCNGQVDEGAGAIWYQDSDADGYGDAANSVQACTQPAGYVADNTDCDDNDATVYPGATEICDGKDNNCNGQVDEGAGAIWYQDSDADGYGDAANSVQACTQPAGYVADNTDCDDNDATVHPGATEICDGKDNNCNGQIDEGAGAIWYRDSDADGYGDAANSLQACTQPAGYVADNTDCDDNDATVHPGATEICDGKDNNCNGQIDEGAGAIWYQDSDADGYGDAANSVQACTQPAGYVADNTDCADNDATVHPGATEICDGKDNNCNGQIDEGAGAIWYQDSDADGYGDAANSLQACTQPAGYVADNTDCADNDATVYPGATEICDGKDNNCNGQVDEGAGAIWYQDSDADGYGDAANSLQACTQPAGYVADNTDCDDNDATVHPGATEVCDGKDNNCNGQVDEGAGAIWYQDSDADGYGDAASSVQACAQPAGYVADNTDCADNDATVHPGATEVCDGKDNNCNGQVDEGAGAIWYQDSDADGYGDAANSLQACTQPAGYVADNTDCDDNDATVHPGATEVCDGKDNNCNGQIDEGAGAIWYRDSDADGYGDAANSVQACTQPAGYVADNTDCDDNDATVHPGATEVCDGKDNNCNGQIDEGAGAIWYQDSDADGYGDAANSLQACTQPAGYVADNTDCADNDATVHPGATEVCDGKDNNCNGQVDEGAGAIWYRDNDADGYGDATNSVQACIQPAGYVADNTDCADNDATVHPGATEICDGKDNNCNGQIDEGAGAIWYRDNDADGYGDAANSLQACTQPAGYVADNTDCADNDATVHPGATEICDGKDNNCNGQIDEGCTNHPVITLTSLSGALFEGKSGTTMDFIFLISLSGRSPVPVTVHYQTVDGSAISSEDYIAKSGVITFPANRLNQILKIQMKGDDWFEFIETFKVKLSQPVNATLGNTEATAYIIDDDPVPFVRVQNAQATELSQQALVRVDLTSPTSFPVRIKYETRNGTAKAPGDFSAATNATLRFKPGETTKYITIPIVWDAINEHTERFTVYILNADYASLNAGNPGARRTATVRIINEQANNSLPPSTRIMSEVLGETKQAAWEVKVQPNPFANSFELVINSEGTEPVMVRIMDRVGRLVKTATFNQTGKPIHMQAVDLKPGLYFAEITQGTQRSVVKLLKVQ